MANTQLIKRRIRSVKNTKQITKAMELVAASKMRRAQEARAKTVAYRNTAREILARLNQLTEAEKFPIFAKRKIKNKIYILITSDRGLAGAYNSNLLKLFTNKLKEDGANEVKVGVITIGRKGSQFVSKLEDIEFIGIYDDFTDKPHVADILPILNTVTGKFAAKDVDKVEIIYTDFKSSISQEATTQTLLPASLSVGEETQPEPGRDINNSIFEPSPAVILNNVVPKLIESQLFQAVLESVASEQSMRMMAMKNASDNASDLIEDLNLEYNSARQAAITQEIAEITGGAAAIS